MNPTITPRRTSALVRSVVATALIAGGVLAAGGAAMAVDSSQQEQPNGQPDTCYEQITLHKYERDTFREESRYEKFTRTSTRTRVQGTWGSWSPWSEWTSWGTYWGGAGNLGNGWVATSVDVLAGPAPHGSGGSGNSEWKREYRYQKVDTRQTKIGTEKSDWLDESPGEEWRLIKTKIVDGEQTWCDPPSGDTEWGEWVGEPLCDATTVTETKTGTKTSYVKGEDFQWVEVIEEVSKERVRELSEEERFDCPPIIITIPTIPGLPEDDDPVEDPVDDPVVEEPTDEVDSEPAVPEEEDVEALTPVDPAPETPAPPAAQPAPIQSLPSTGSTSGVLAAVAALMMLTGLGLRRFGVNLVKSAG